MRHEVIYIMVRVVVRSPFESIAKTVGEFERNSIPLMTDTVNVKVLESEILLTRTRNPFNNHKTKNNGR